MNFSFKTGRFYSATEDQIIYVQVIDEENLYCDIFEENYTISTVHFTDAVRGIKGEIKIVGDVDEKEVMSCYDKGNYTNI